MDVVASIISYWWRPNARYPHNTAPEFGGRFPRPKPNGPASNFGCKSESTAAASIRHLWLSAASAAAASSVTCEPSAGFM
eukprot:scaffold37981_cov53-Prasinocladus_malaysianus.AAC.1